MQYLVPLVYLKYTQPSGECGQMREGRVSLALDCWKIWGIEICFRLKIGLSFHVWGLSDDEGTSCGAGFLILSPPGFTAATLALGLHGPCPKLSPQQLSFLYPTLLLPCFAHHFLTTLATQQFSLSMCSRWEITKLMYDRRSRCDHANSHITPRAASSEDGLPGTALNPPPPAHHRHAA